MNNSDLNNLLKEYEKTRLNNIYDSENRKKELYLSNPRLQEIDETLAKLSIDTAKSILKNNSLEYISNFKKEVESLKKEKNEIFKALKLPSNYLEPHFNCPFCKDTGYIFNGNTSQMCNCLKQKIFDIEYNKSSIGLENFTNFNLNLYSNTADENKYNSKLSPQENIKMIKEAAENFIENFEAEKNLLFTGGTGLRKNIFIKLYSKRIIK